VQNGDIIDNRNFTTLEYETATPILLVNEKVIEKLFLNEATISKDIHFDNQLFHMINMFKPLSNIFDNNNQNKAIVPLTTAQRKLNINIHWIDLTIKPRENTNHNEIMDDMIATLRSTHHLKPSEKNDFFISTPKKLMELYDRIIGIFFLVIIILSTIGLLVGGVGVVAIMMISVTERTRKIGVHKALDATHGTIL